MHVEDETHLGPEQEADEVLEIELADAVVHPRTVVVELGHAAVAVGAVLGAQRLVYDARAAELLNAELVLLDELEQDDLLLVGAAVQHARIGAVHHVEVVPGEERGDEQQRAVHGHVKDERTEVDEPGDVEQSDERHADRHWYVLVEVFVEEEALEGVRAEANEAVADQLAAHRHVRLQQHPHEEQQRERIDLREKLARFLKRIQIEHHIFHTIYIFDDWLGWVTFLPVRNLSCAGSWSLSTSECERSRKAALLFLRSSANSITV